MPQGGAGGLQPGVNLEDRESLADLPGDNRAGLPDAYHAALAIESGATWITNDRGNARFPNLRRSTALTHN